MSSIGDKGFPEKLFPERGDMRAFSNTFIPETEIIQKARARGQEIGTYDALQQLDRYFAISLI